MALSKSESKQTVEAIEKAYGDAIKYGFIAKDVILLWITKLLIIDTIARHSKTSTAEVMTVTKQQVVASPLQTDWDISRDDALPLCDKTGSQLIRIFIRTHIDKALMELTVRAGVCATLTEIIKVLVVDCSHHFGGT